MYANMLQELAAERIGDMRRQTAARRRVRDAVQSARERARRPQIRVPESAEVAEHSAREEELTGACR